MATRMLSVLLLGACAIGVCHGWFGRSRPSGCRIFMSTSEAETCFPCRFFGPREVTLVVRNILREPTFEESVKLSCTRSKTLFYMMMEAAEANTVFMFSVTYFSGLGFYIDSINGTAGNYTLDKSYWQILDGDNKPTLLGVSSYEPHNGETVTFNFTQYAGH
ncbi:cobalamin binding intrinsic factor-like isoform X2 [Babylonia areolata]|uniref:cobalamin binding intrinsic factor-like isoform X2 n=1 Tax=Babylonia areolata TaxID=304850 RepID=UPI003FD677D1